MTKTFCDRCGKEGVLAWKEDVHVWKVTWHNREKILDLCEDCHDAVVEFATEKVGV